MHAPSSPQQLAYEAVAILESISDGFFSLNQDWEFTYVNVQAEGLLGVTHDSLLGRSLWDAYPGLHGTAFEAFYRNAMRERAADEITAWYPEHQKWYAVRVAPLAAGLSFYFRDVSAQVATEAALRESERSFRQLADSIPQIVWIVDASGRNVYFNRQWDAYTGVPIDSSSPADIAGEFVHPDDRAATMQAWNAAYEQRRDYQVEHRIRSAAGDYRWFLVRAEPYVNADGAIERWFGTSTDIHDEKLAKIALAEGEARYRQLFEALETAGRRHAFQLALADRIRPLTDPEEVTAAASELLGKEVGGKRVVYGETDAGGAWIHMHPDWTDGGMASMRGVRLRLDDFGVAAVDLLRAGRNLVLDDVTRDAATAPHAAAYQAAGMGAALGIPLMKDGRLQAVLSVHDDVAHHWTPEQVALAEDMVDRTWFALDSLRAQAALRAERDQSRQIFDNMAEGFALLDADWTILQVNETGTRLIRRTHAELLGRKLWDAMPHLAGGPVEALYRRVQAGGQPEYLEHRQILPDGAGAWIESRAYPLPEQRLAVFFRDIGKRKEAEDKLREADRRKDEFLAMLAHELRNPLAPIGAAAHLLRLGRLDEERVRHTSQILGRQVDHMTHLIDDLLDVSRVTRGLVELDMAPVDIRHVVADAIEQVAPLMQKRRHHLHSHIPPDTTVVLGDRQRLVQVLANILNNAAKYTDEGGSISLTSEVRADHVVIEVSDNGIGMTPELAARAFDLFAQAERTSDRAAGGLGLGLALVKSLVELHGGSVTAASAGLGQGSRFSVCLPRMAAAPASEAAGAGDGAAAPAKAALRVLVVDDNADAAAMLAMVLQAYGHQVAVEHGSLAALARARSERPDVCILDIGLPDIDGNELARRLRALPETAHAVLIAVTGYGHDSDRRKSLAAGFDHHLVKPADAAQLAAILAGIGKA
ncbi:PAS domain-containing protein [Massilia sp. YIM B02769]|uniref:PAS domain-containing protein n=1 Tax=unclassified Massilia TaxID=2609279 RepID=UPI0025B62F56|nr:MULTISPECIES: PAS domain-containing protein [unclassified Massilia]MDN4057206.1 PAS domain-containing protein [Massilia sp. YIM B02769]